MKTDRPDSAESLRRLYSEEGMTLRQIAAKYGVFPNAVVGWMEKFGIERREARGVRSPTINEATLRALYVEDRFSIKEIAKEYGLARGTVTRGLRKAGIPLRKYRRTIPLGKRAVRPLVDHPTLPNVLMVPVGCSRFALIDEADGDCVSKYNWSPHSTPNTVYAQSKTQEGDNRRQLSMHRLIFDLGEGDERVQVDHKNHDGLDNRRSNLRLATSKQNATNIKKRKGVSSKYKGVSWDKGCDRWAARISHNRKLLNLGIFAIEEEAAVAYLCAAELLKDSEFLCVVPISEDRSPSPERIKEIRATTIGKIKELLIGKKSNKGAHSRFRGISIFKHRWKTRDGEKGSDRWQASIASNKVSFYLGRFDAESEAAYAVISAANQLFRAIPTPCLAPSQYPDAETRSRIDSNVAVRIRDKLKESPCRSRLRPLHRGRLLRMMPVRP